MLWQALSPATGVCTSHVGRAFWPAMTPSGVISRAAARPGQALSPANGPPKDDKSPFRVSTPDAKVRDLKWRDCGFRRNTRESVRSKYARTLPQPAGRKRIAHGAGRGDGAWGRGKRASLNCVSFLPAPPAPDLAARIPKARPDAITQIAQFRLACFPRSTSPYRPWLGRRRGSSCNRR